MKTFTLVLLLFIFATFSITAQTFTVSGSTWLNGDGVPLGGVTISASSTDCNGWIGTSVENPPLASSYSLEIPQACHNLQVTAFKRGYVFSPSVWSFTFPVTQTAPIGPRDFIVN